MKNRILGYIYKYQQEKGSVMKWRRSRKIACVTAALLLAVTASGCSSSGSPGTDPGTDHEIVVGTNNEVTGAAGSFGQWYQKGVEVAVHAINESGGVEIDGKKYQMKLESTDNETDPQKALGNMRKLARDDVKFVMGPASSALSPAIFKQFVGQDVLMMSNGITSLKFMGEKGANDLFHTQAPSTYTVAQLATRTAETYDVKTAALLLPQDTSGDVHLSLLAEALKSAGVEIVYSDQFDPTTRDFAPFVTKIKNANPDAVYTGYLDAWVGPILDAASEVGLSDVPFMGTNGTSIGVFKDHPEFRGALNIVTRAVDRTDDPQVQGFRESWKDLYGSYPDDPNAFWALAYYDGTRMLARAMEIAGTSTDVPAIAEAMHDPEAEKYEGRALDLRFDDNNAAQYSTQIAEIKDGKAFSYIEVPAAD